MEETLAAKRKAIAVCNQGVVQQLYDVIAELGWDCYDDVAVEIVIKNKTRDQMVFSSPNPDLKAHHLKTEKELAAEIKKSDDAKMYDTYSK